MYEELIYNYMNETYSYNIITIKTNRPQKITQSFPDGRVFTVYIRYNRSLSNWFLDIYKQDGINLIPQALNIMLECGLDLLSQYKYRNLGEFYVFSKNPMDFDSPTYNTLSTQFYYVWRF